MNAVTVFVWYLSRCDHKPNTKHFWKDKILINCRPLDKRLQGNCVCPPGRKSFVSILMATTGSQGDSICSWGHAQNDFPVLHS